MTAPCVLIADDDVGVSRVLARAFTRAGCAVSVATNGGQALEAIRGTRFDALITDINMPVMTGRELCEHLEAEGPALPRCMVVVTARTRLEERSWADEIPGLTLLEKPISPRELVRFVIERLDEARRLDEPNERGAA